MQSLGHMFGRPLVARNNHWWPEASRKSAKCLSCILVCLNCKLGYNKAGSDKVQPEQFNIAVQYSTVEYPASMSATQSRGFELKSWHRLSCVRYQIDLWFSLCLHEISLSTPTPSHIPKNMHVSLNVDCQCDCFFVNITGGWMKSSCCQNHHFSWDP